MNVGTAHSEVNPNTRVMNSRGIWLSYVLGIGLLHVILLSIPFFSVPVVWTLTNIIHNMHKEIYFLTSFYTKYDRIHFIINTISLMSVLIPKLPQLHGVRIFGINKY
ncbi:hypothetical protein JD844_002148 [Phrynosoma platyrhinos]|uniref:ORM1-like protein 3 n=1 Tax=Phrynosoma platyrhinos TaxID=52577 RepID=A0ABQ7TCI3_PHRPL|nr:hypothetical protein JD844_002148 [Phrynosoma platyrhinos]